MKGIILYENGNEEKIIKMLKENNLEYVRTLHSINYIIFDYIIEQEEIVKELSEKIKGMNLETKIQRIKDPESEEEVEEWHSDL